MLYEYISIVSWYRICINIFNNHMLSFICFFVILWDNNDKIMLKKTIAFLCIYYPGSWRFFSYFYFKISPTTWIVGLRKIYLISSFLLNCIRFIYIVSVDKRFKISSKFKNKVSCARFWYVTNRKLRGLNPLLWCVREQNWVWRD